MVTSGFGRSCVDICNEYYLALTQADTVGSVTTLEALKAFLGTIDTADEAVLVAQAATAFNFSCSDKSRGAVRKTDTGSR